jgi:hypothetical protein
MCGLANIESTFLREATAAIHLTKPIYVCGLARSGTTIALECLAAHPQVGSHQYRDFPGVLIPFWWDWFLQRAGSSREQTRERAHGDGLQITSASPEAMEQAVWNAFFPRGQDGSDVLERATENSQFETFYREHIRKVLLVRGRRRYCAKENYNISRMAYLLRLFPDARFVLIVRDPVEWVASSIKTDRRFAEAAAQDPRVGLQLRRRGHFEFSPNRRTIDVGDGKASAELASLWETDEIRAWAIYWSMIHRFVAGQLREDENVARACAVVRYDDLCRAPSATLRKIFDHVELEVSAEFLHRQVLRVQAPPAVENRHTEADIHTIREETDQEAAFFGYGGPSGSRVDA